MEVDENVFMLVLVASSLAIGVAEATRTDSTFKIEVHQVTLDILERFGITGKKVSAFLGWLYDFDVAIVTQARSGVEDRKRIEELIDSLRKVAPEKEMRDA